MPEKGPTILIGAQRFTGWTRVSITRSIESLVGKFELGLIDTSESGDWDFTPGVPAKIGLGEDDILTGYIDRVETEVSKDTRSMRVAGRDKPSDLIDCSPVPNDWKGRNIGVIAADIAKPFGIRVYSDVDIGEPFPVYTLQSGGTAYDAIEEGARQRGLIAISDELGNILLTHSGGERSHDQLEYKKNVLRASASYDYTDRFSEYTVKGQSTGGGNPWGNGTTTQIFGKATDEGIQRFRPKVFSTEKYASNSSAKKRAEWEASVRAGRSSTIQIVVQGWRQSNDELWAVNRLTNVKVPPLNLDMDLLITELTYSLGEQGSLTTLTLKRDDIFAPMPKPVVKPKKKKVRWV